MKKQYFLSSLSLVMIIILLVSSVSFAQKFVMVDEFETHNWHAFGWGDDSGSLEYSSAWSSDGDYSLKLTTTYGGSGWYIYGTGCFDLESPDSIKMDIYSPDYQRLEIKYVLNNSEQLVGAKTCYSGNTYLNYNINTVGKSMRKLYIVPAWYSGTVTIYIDNIRTYKNGVETVWDSFEKPDNYWDGSADADNKDYQTLYSDDITHSKHSNNFNSTASQSISWDQNVYPEDSVAQLTMTFDQAKDWSDYYYFRADIYRLSTTPNCSLFVFLWDESDGVGTDWITVPANQWTTVTWKLGMNLDLTNIKEVKIVIPNTQLHQSGEIYIDNLQVGGFIPNNTAINLDSIGVRYSLDDFDGRVPDPVDKDSVVRAGYNDYFGYTGGAKSSMASLDISLSNIENNGTAHTEPFALRLEYDVSYDEHTWISYWNLLGSGASPPPRDLSEMDKFSIWIKGDNTAGYSNRISVEFHDDQWGNPGYDSGKAFAVLSGITNEWQQWVIPIDPDSMVIWGTFDPSKITEVVISLDSSSASNTTGKFYVDDIQFIDTDEVFFDDNDFDEDFLDLVTRRTFNYFYEARDNTTGLTLDRATFPDLATVAGTGFGLAAIVIGTERGWITSSEAEEWVEDILENLWNTPQGISTTGVSGYKGFYYHFLDAATGLRKQAPEGREPVELSVVDTGILMAGVLLAQEYYNNNSNIVDLADKLFRRVDWPWFYDQSVNQFYLGWAPEKMDSNKGFVGHWDVSTDEVMLINILAVASPTHPVPSNCFYGWQRDVGTYNNNTIINSWNGSLFQYFFTHCWFDLHGKKDAQGVNWFDNSVKAGNANRDYCIAAIDGSGRTNIPTYSSSSWGLTATEQVPAGIDTLYFGENGTLPTFQSDFDPNFNGIYFGENNGTVPPYGAGSMIGFAAYEDGFNSTYVYDALKNYYLNTQLWTGNYGFRDCYTDTTSIKHIAWSKFPMYKNNFFSIDQGPMLMMIENYRSKLIWEYLGENDYIQHAINEIFVPDFRVNDDLTGTTQLSPSTTANKAGQYVTVWNDRRDENHDFIYVQEFHNVDDVGIFRVNGVNKKVSALDSLSIKPKVAINGNGKYMITWFESNNLIAKILAFQDSTNTTTSVINTTSIYSNEQSSAVASSEFGKFAVAWTGVENGKDVYFQLIDSTGNKVGTNLKLNDDVSDYDQRQPDIAIADNGASIVVWEDNRNGSSEIYAQRLSSTGEKVSANFKISGTLLNSILPSVDINQDGTFIISWIDTSTTLQRNIYATKFNSSGARVGSIINVSSNAYGPALCKPDIVVDSLGAFIVVWQDSREGSMDIYYQKYNSAGSAIGTNSRVHSPRPYSSQIEPAITFIGNNGGYQIVWQDDRNGDWDIYCPVDDLKSNKHSDVDKQNPNIPIEYALAQNYPNPFNPATTIQYSIPIVQKVRLDIYDMLGRKVKTLVNEVKEAGIHKAHFNASDLASGMYIYRVIAGNFVQSKKMILLK